MRETGIVGILGVRALYIDSAISELHFDRAVVPILLTGILNLSADALSRALRGRLRLTTRVSTGAA